MRKVSSLILALFVGFVAVLSGTAHASKAHGMVYDISSTYRGSLARWTDPDWTNIPCPSTGNINAMVSATSVVNQNQSFIQIGSTKEKYIDPFGLCQTRYYYYWEWDSSSGYNTGMISSPAPRGTHDFSVNRVPTGCAAGVSWCWSFRIDGTSKHTCCGDVSEFASTGQIAWQVECLFSGSSCGTGAVDPASNFQYKTTSDTWVPWSGQDAGCADTAEGAKAKFITATSAKAGFNTTITGSFTNACG
jgi:hypothetical protein